MTLNINQQDIQEDPSNLQLNELKGATIQNIGFTKHTSEGGLTIDFTKNGISKRIIIGSNDLGVWIHSLEDRKEWTDIERKDFQEIIELKNFIRKLYQEEPYVVNLSQFTKEQKEIISKKLKVNRLKESDILDFTYGP